MMRVLTALLIGLAVGAGAAALGGDRLVAAALALEPVGTLWTNAIRMVVIPLIVSVIITSVAGQRDLHRSGRAGGLTVLLFVSLLFAGGLFAALVVPYSFDHLAIGPEVVEKLRAGASSTNPVAQQMPSHLQRVLDAVPANPVKAAAEGALLPLVVFSFIFATALTRLDSSRREPVIQLFEGISQAMLVVVRWILLLAPVGIFALAVGLGARVGGGRQALSCTTRLHCRRCCSCSRSCSTRSPGCWAALQSRNSRPPRCRRRQLP